jgi:hypothetical protein
MPSIRHTFSNIPARCSRWSVKVMGRFCQRTKPASFRPRKFFTFDQHTVGGGAGVKTEPLKMADKWFLKRQHGALLTSKN